MKLCLASLILQVVVAVVISFGHIIVNVKSISQKIKKRNESREKRDVDT
jgi:hypothetical protein